MPPPISVDDQTKLLLSMISNCQGFKTNWDAVAEECGCSTASAAQQRYNRIAKANKEGGKKDTGEATESPKAPRKTAGRKKKANATVENGNNDGTVPESPTKKRKMSSKAQAKAVMDELVKEEPEEPEEPKQEDTV